MAESAKKVRTAAQLEANKRASEKGKSGMAWLEAHKADGVEKSVLNTAVVNRLLGEGKSDAEIVAAIKARQAERKEKKATGTPKAAPKAAPKANAAPTGTGNNATKKKNNNAASTASSAKVKSAARNAANAETRRIMQWFKNNKLKASNPARSFYVAKKKEGMSNNAIAAAMKNVPEYQANAPPVPRPKKTVAAANSSAAARVVANAGTVSKGSYICERCQFVGTDKAVVNNGTRKNKKGNTTTNYSTNNYFPVNSTNF